jgi:uncharacterized protein (TIGR02145 family)
LAHLLAAQSRAKPKQAKEPYICKLKREGMRKKSFIISIGLLTLLLLSHCSEDDGPTLAKVSTTSISDITAQSAKSGGDISNDGGSTITEKGIVWDTNSNPTILLSTKTSDGSGLGSFTSSITNLTPGTKYYVRAFATNNSGTAYGNEIAFTTSAATLPAVTTAALTDVTATAAKSGGVIVSDGGIELIAKGVVWSTTSNPTISLTTKTNNVTESATYSSRLYGLEPNTTYYTRAYATNDIGTAYGAELSFTTTSIVTGPVTDIDGNVYQTVTIGNQSWMLTNLKTTKYRDGSSITTGLNEDQWAAATSGAYAIYGNNQSSDDVYGKLYNWYAATDERNVCPTGFHLPTIEDWTILAEYLGGFSVAGAKMKEAGLTHWLTPNNGATNSSGFTALPSGWRQPNTNFGATGFVGQRQVGAYWLDFEYNDGDGAFSNLSYLDVNLGAISSSKKVTGFSIRCLRD